MCHVLLAPQVLSYGLPLRQCAPSHCSVLCLWMLEYSKIISACDRHPPIQTNASDGSCSSFQVVDSIFFDSSRKKANASKVGHIRLVCTTAHHCTSRYMCYAQPASYLCMCMICQHHSSIVQTIIVDTKDIVLLHSMPCEAGNSKLELTC